MTTLTEFKEIEAKATKGRLFVDDGTPGHIKAARTDGVSTPTVFRFDIWSRLRLECGTDYGGGIQNDEEEPNAQRAAISWSALPALIAVAEGMALAMREAIRIGDLPVKKHIRANMDAKLRVALIAFEAWKNEIEKEPKP